MGEDPSVYFVQTWWQYDGHFLWPVILTYTITIKRNVTLQYLCCSYFNVDCMVVFYDNLRDSNTVTRLENKGSGQIQWAKRPTASDIFSWLTYMYLPAEARAGRM